MFRYMNIVLQDLIIITSLVSITKIVMELLIATSRMNNNTSSHTAHCIGTCAACNHNKNNSHFTYYLFSKNGNIK